jgi:hypothetical protein
VDSLIHTCRGMLSVHKNSLVSCSESTCRTSRSSEQALGSHSCVVVCRQPRCVDCADQDAVKAVCTGTARMVALSTASSER